VLLWTGRLSLGYTIVRYATEVDVDFVRKSVRAIGRCAIKVEQAAERCVSTLLDLIQTKVNYVVQEAVIVIKVNFFSSLYSTVSTLYRVIVFYSSAESLYALKFTVLLSRAPSFPRAAEFRAEPWSLPFSA